MFLVLLPHSVDGGRAQRFVDYADLVRVGQQYCTNTKGDGEVLSCWRNGHDKRLQQRVSPFRNAHAMSLLPFALNVLCGPVGYTDTGVAHTLVEEGTLTVIQTQPLL